MRVMKVEVPNRGEGLMIMPDDNNWDEAEMLKRFSGGTLEVEGEGQDGITLFVWQKQKLKVTHGAFLEGLGIRMVIELAAQVAEMNATLKVIAERIPRDKR